MSLSTFHITKLHQNEHVFLGCIDNFSWGLSVPQLIDQFLRQRQELSMKKVFMSWAE